MARTRAGLGEPERLGRLLGRLAQLCACGGPVYRSGLLLRSAWTQQCDVLPSERQGLLRLVEYGPDPAGPHARLRQVRGFGVHDYFWGHLTDNSAQTSIHMQRLFPRCVLCVCVYMYTCDSATHPDIYKTQTNITGSGCWYMCDW